MKSILSFWSVACVLVCLDGFQQVGVAQNNLTAKITVHTDQPGIVISPTLYGIFFEEINCAGDGGIYAELLRNRSFEESRKPDYWTLMKDGAAESEMRIDTINASGGNNRRCLQLTMAGRGTVSVANEGYWGIPLKKDAEYVLSLRAKCAVGQNTQLTASLQSADGTIYAEQIVDGVRAEWKQQTTSFVVHKDVSKARLVISLSKPGTVWLDVISLFPKQTFKNRSNGLRSDLASMLSELHPAFVRFPGGCWVEGEDLSLSYRWKQTIGAIGDRRTQYNIWQYYSTNGLGYHEYLQMCEDLGAEPLFVINCGMSHRENVPMDQMQSWVQDALDAIEYANGAVDSPWGSVRATNGHPTPFNLKYMEIGNENGGPAYRQRYALMYNAIKKKYPAMHLIADVWGGYPKDVPVELIDEHYYSSPKFFINNSDRYDKYDRKGPKIYVGEYAVTQGCGKGNLRAALGEAAFMTGMERNSDVVLLASYAPLFANVNYKKWNPDLINFDNTILYGTPSYYVQKMFSENRGDVILPVELSVSGTVSEPVRLRNGKIGVGTWSTQAEYKDLKVEKNGAVLYWSDFEKGTGDWTVIGGTWKSDGGVYRQIDDGSDRRSVSGDTEWIDYTYSLKARKLRGAEGFLILFSVKDDDNYVWWNIGGWGNTQNGIEYCEDGGKTILGKQVPGNVETNRWYDVRVVLHGDSIHCYLDGKLIQSVSYENTPVKPLHVVASLKKSNGELILKLVNVSKQDVDGVVDLSGLVKVDANVHETILTSPNPTDENSIEEPRKVVPKESTFQCTSNTFRKTLPANSLTILRVKNAE